MGVLQLYANAEIERRIGDGDLRKRDPTLNYHIVERLVGGAEGRQVLANSPPRIICLFHVC